MESGLIKEGLLDRLIGLIEAAPDTRSIQAKDWYAVGSLAGPRPENQDRACVFHVSYAERPHDDLLVGVVCDGMGGMSQGGEASTLALSAFVTELTASRQVGEDRFRAALTEANRAVFDRLGGRGGSTLTAVASSARGETWCVHAGDSRLYSFKHNELVLVTKDDTLSGIINEGDPTNIEELHDNRLIQFVGIGKELQPHIIKLTPDLDQSWLITSDGAHGLGRKMMRAIAGNARSSVDLARKILFIVDAAPLGDNASVVTLIPSTFEAPRHHMTGVNLTVWTSTDRLELWIDDSSASTDSDPLGSGRNFDTNNHDIESTRSYPHSREKKRKKGKAFDNNLEPSTRRKKKVDKKAEPPHLNIIFGDEQDK
jgi:PPM family protein phosphatase